MSEEEARTTIPAERYEQMEAENKRRHDEVAASIERMASSGRETAEVAQVLGVILEIAEAETEGYARLDAIRDIAKSALGRLPAPTETAEAREYGELYENFRESQRLLGEARAEIERLQGGRPCTCGDECVAEQLAWEIPVGRICRRAASRGPAQPPTKPIQGEGPGAMLAGDMFPEDDAPTPPPSGEREQEAERVDAVTELLWKAIKQHGDFIRRGVPDERWARAWQGGRAEALGEVLELLVHAPTQSEQEGQTRAAEQGEAG